MSAHETISATKLAIGNIGGQFYFTPETVGTGKAAGLDGFRFYIIGRGGVMGDVSGAVVQSAFGYFNPEVLVPMWDTGTATMPATDVAALYWECGAEHGRSKLADTGGLAEFCDAADAVIAAADRDGLPLFAGIATMPVAEDLPARAYQLCMVLRELRGSAHLGAIRCAGLVPREAHAHKRPEMVKSFGWGEIEPAEDTAAKLAIAEDLTDTALTACYSALEDQAAAAFVSGVAAIAASCEV